MPPSQTNNWWQLHVQVLLKEFYNSNISTSQRFKCLALMSIINERAGSFDTSTGMSSTEIADAMGVPLSSISAALGFLEERGFIRRYPASGRGGRLTITPLSTVHWRVSSKGGLLYDADKTIHDDISENIVEPVDNYIPKRVNDCQMKNTWAFLMDTLVDVLNKTKTKHSHEPSKLLAVMTIITLHSDEPGKPCSIYAEEIGDLINHSPKTMVTLLGRLENLGFIKRELVGVKKEITPILPTSFAK